MVKVVEINEVTWHVLHLNARCVLELAQVLAHELVDRVQVLHRVSVVALVGVHFRMQDEIRREKLEILFRFRRTKMYNKVCL